MSQELQIRALCQRQLLPECPFADAVREHASAHGAAQLPSWPALTETAGIEAAVPASSLGLGGNSTSDSDEDEST